MRKSELLERCTLFASRIPPAEYAGRSHSNSPVFAGISADDYSVYYACRGPNSSPVREIAHAIGARSERISKLCARVEFQLDLNILKHRPEWAYSLVPFAVSLRMFGNKLTRAEEYLGSVAEILPKLSLRDSERAELLGWTLEHLGGVLLHRGHSEDAGIVLQRGEVAFNRLARSTDDGHLRGVWKHRALQCALLTADAAAQGKQYRDAHDLAQLLVNETRDLDHRARQASRSFPYRGHRFREVTGEVQRLRGVIFSKLGSSRDAENAADESVGIMQELQVERSAPNQLVASYIKRADALHERAASSLDDLAVAARLIDRHEETGVYQVLIDKTRCELLLKVGDRDLAEQIAKRSMESARRLGLYHQQSTLARLLYVCHSGTAKPR